MPDNPDSTMPANAAVPAGPDTPRKAMSPTPPAPSPGSSEPVVPSDLKVKLAEQRLHVTWADGSQCVYDLAVLRRHCPCATCRIEREQRSDSPGSLTILKADPRNLRTTGAKLVGRYAIQFEWSDGHNTGIFDFRFLRTLPSVPAE
ncbi:MAG: DUF971 domain-containing protein [Planctomycetes bacterium]|nr:DUF971 domain-containing protein [Planctomycetota bacterium]